MDLAAGRPKREKKALQLGHSIGLVKSLRKWDIEGKLLVIPNELKHNHSYS
jgi:hypothetical protein